MQTSSRHVTVMVVLADGCTRCCVIGDAQWQVQKLLVLGPHLKKFVNKNLGGHALDDDCAVANNPDTLDVGGYNIVDGRTTSIASVEHRAVMLESVHKQRHMPGNS